MLKRSILKNLSGIFACYADTERKQQQEVCICILAGASLKPVALGTWFKFSRPSCQGSVEGYIMAETSSKIVKICKYVFVG